MHPLDDADERIRRAREHLEDLKPRIYELRGTVRDQVSLTRRPGFHTQPDGRKVRAVIGSVSGPINFPAPRRIRTLIGEVVQNLRTALDYLVYELARFDAKRIIEGTQFPIVDLEADFEKARKKRLRGLNGEHIAMIKRLQPCDGCQWTGMLRDLSNPDKHRELTAVKSPILVAPSPGSTEAILAGKDVDVQGDVTISITFPDGTPVIEGLELFQSQAAQTIYEFKSEFQ